MFIKKYLFPFLVLIAVSLALSSCDTQLTQPEVAPPLLDIPASGLSPLPDLGSGDLVPSGVAGQGELPPAYRLLEKYAAEHPEDPWVAVVGVWNPEEQHFAYKAVPLDFPPELVADAGMAYFRYRLEATKDGLLRNLAATIPHHPQALQAMARWLQLAPAVPSDPLVAGALSGAGGGNQDCIDIPGREMPYCLLDEITVTANRMVSEEWLNSLWQDEWPTEQNGTGGGGGSDRPEDSGECPLNCYGGGGGPPPPEEEQIIIDPSFEDTKAECVYDNLKSSSTGFAAAIQKFDGEFPVSHLKFATDNLPDNTRGQTTPPENYVIKITLNNDSSNNGINYRPNLLTAKTLIHEVIHAEMFRKMLSLSNSNGSIDVSRLRSMLENGDYPGMLDYYLRYGVNGFQHQQMAQHYRETIGRALQEFDTGLSVPNNQQPQQLYIDLAWEGLNHSNIVAWQNVVDSDRIDDVIENYIDQNKNEGCQ